MLKQDKVLDGLKKTGKAVGQIGLGTVKLLAGVLAIVGLGYTELAKEQAEYSYSGAIKAIMDSTLYDYKKCETIEILKKDADSEYYKSVIEILKSNIYDYKKIEMIEYLSKQETESVN